MTHRQTSTDPPTFRGRFGSGTIVRTARDRDQYLVWSSNTGGPTFVGTAAELLASAHPDERTLIAARIDRATHTGTSAMNGCGSWDDYGLIYDHRGWILRADLALFADLVAADNTTAGENLLTPLDPEGTRA